MAQTLGQRGRGQQRIFALPQIGVVEVEREREHVNGQGIRKGGLKKAALCLFVDPALFHSPACEGLVHAGESSLRHARAGAFVAPAVQCPAPAFVAVLAGFAAHLGQRLRPRQVAETLRHPGSFDKVVPHIDKEFEGQRKPVLHQPGGDEDAIRAVKLHIAVTHGAIAQVDGVAWRHHRLLGFANGERHKIICMPGERGGDCIRHRLHDRLQLLCGDVRIGKDRVTQAVFGLTHGRLLRHERRR